MGTHCCLRIITRKRTISQYIHYDGYSVMERVVFALKILLEYFDFSQLENFFDELKVMGSKRVDENNVDFSFLEKFSDLSVSTRSKSDPYCLLRKCQNNLINTLLSGYIDQEGEGESQEFNVELDFMKEEVRELAYGNETTLTFGRITEDITPDEMKEVHKDVGENLSALLEKYNVNH